MVGRRPVATGSNPLPLFPNLLAPAGHCRDNNGQYRGEDHFYLHRARDLFLPGESGWVLLFANGGLTFISGCFSTGGEGAGTWKKGGNTKRRHATPCGFQLFLKTKELEGVENVKSPAWTGTTQKKDDPR